MADSVLRTKSKEFAKNIVFLCRRLKQSGVESALINQLLRCGTSVGANVHEAQYAQGTKDFISKFEIALKECNESEYWLELLYETGSIQTAKKEGIYNYETIGLYDFGRIVIGIGSILFPTTQSRNNRHYRSGEGNS